MEVKPLICASILSSDLSNLSQECKKIIKDGIDYLHLDVMDGHFVPNMTFGPPVIKCLRKNIKGYFDVHLMIESPEKWVKHYSDAGADSITFHYEAVEKDEDVKNLLLEIRKLGKKNGIVLKPKTEIKNNEFLINLLKNGDIDMVLIMTVEPGFGGQKFMEDMMPKIKFLRDQFPKLNIQVDGGVDLNTIETCAKAGANVFVSGTGILKHKNRKKVIKEMREKCKKYFK